MYVYTLLYFTKIKQKKKKKIFFNYLFSKMVRLTQTCRLRDELGEHPGAGGQALPDPERRAEPHVPSAWRAALGRRHQGKSP